MSKTADGSIPPTVLCRVCNQHIPGSALSEEPETEATLDKNNTVKCKVCRA